MEKGDPDAVSLLSDPEVSTVAGKFFPSVQTTNNHGIKLALENYAASMTETSAKIISDNFERSINDLVLIPEDTKITENPEDEELIGARIFQNVTDLCRGFGILFETVVAHDYNFNDAKNDLTIPRNEAIRAFEDGSLKSSIILVVPDKSIYETEADSAFREFVKNDPAVENETAGQRKQRHAIREEEISYDYKDNYVKDYKQYRRLVDIRNVATERASFLKTQVSRLAVLELLLNAMNSAIRKLAAKIRAAADRVPGIRQKLLSTTVIARVGHTISNPYGLGNLTGMLQILFEHFHENTFLSNTNQLLRFWSKTLTFKETSEQPDTIVDFAERTLADVDRKDNWSGLTTKDQVFTAIIIHGLSHSPYRNHILSEVVKKEAELNKDDDRLERAKAGSMPLFRFISKYIRQDMANRTLNTRQHTQQQQQKNPGGGSQHPPKNYQHFRNRHPAEESAAAAIPAPAVAPPFPWPSPSPPMTPRDLYEMAAAAAAHSAASTPVKPAATVSPVDAIPRYRDEIFRDKGVIVKDPNSTKTYPYLAVVKQSKVCPMCFPDKDSVPIPKTCGGRCYRARCSACRFYGHKSSTCMQTHDVDGVPVPKK